jgi:Flp pilus assembly protein TadD
MLDRPCHAFSSETSGNKGALLKGGSVSLGLRDADNRNASRPEAMRRFVTGILGVLLLGAVAFAQVLNDLTPIRVKLEQGDFISAIPKLEAHLKVRPGDAEAHFLLARAYYLAGGVVNLGRSSDHIKEALKSNTPRLEYYWLQGLIQATQGKFQLALSNLRVAATGESRVTTPRDFYRFSMDWGAVAWRSGDLRQALEAYRRANKADGTQPFPLLNAGVIYLSLSEPERAEPELTKAVVLFQQYAPKHPAYAEAQYNRGRALESLGRFEAARGAYRAALTLDPSFRIARDALEALSSR